jgi:hypothetical protein
VNILFDLFLCQFLSQIGHVRHQIVDKMQYDHPDFFQELVLELGLDWCKFVQNGKTLGQVFELL